VSPSIWNENPVSIISVFKEKNEIFCSFAQSKIEAFYCLKWKSLIFSKGNCVQSICLFKRKLLTSSIFIFGNEIFFHDQFLGTFNLNHFFHGWWYVQISNLHFSNVFLRKILGELLWLWDPFVRFVQIKKWKIKFSMNWGFWLLLWSISIYVFFWKMFPHVPVERPKVLFNVNKYSFKSRSWRTNVCSRVWCFRFLAFI
jgi:hypothetical protein